MVIRNLYRVVCQYRSPRNGQLDKFTFDTVLSTATLNDEAALAQAVGLVKHLLAGTAVLEQLAEPVYSYMGESPEERHKNITGAYIQKGDYGATN